MGKNKTSYIFEFPKRQTMTLNEMLDGIRYYVGECEFSQENWDLIIHIKKTPTKYNLRRMYNFINNNLGIAHRVKTNYDHVLSYNEVDNYRFKYEERQDNLR